MSATTFAACPTCGTYCRTLLSWRPIFAGETEHYLHGDCSACGSTRALTDKFFDGRKWMHVVDASRFRSTEAA